jgi:hypothetical protein
MAAIKENFGHGGANMVPSGAQGEPTAALALRDIADDLASLKGALIASPDATDLATAITLVNEIKGMLNAVFGTTLKTTKA